MTNKKPLLVIFLTVFLDLVGFGIIIPMHPYLARQFGADPFEVGLLMSIYSIMQFLFSPFWGTVSDKVGRRPIILMSVFGASLAHLMFAFAETLTVLFIARALAGLFGANISTAMAYVADITPKEDRSKSMGLIGAAFGLGFILGPFLGGVAGHWGQMLGSAPPFGHNFPAVIASAITFINFILAYFILKETLTEENKKQAKKRPSRFRLLMSYVSKPVLGSLMIVYFLSGLGMAHMEASLIMLVDDKFNWSMVKASFGFAYVGLIMVFTQGFIIRKIIHKLGERLIMSLGLAAFCIGYFLIAQSESIMLLAIAVTFVGLGHGLFFPSIQGSISLLSSSSEQGTVLGVNQSLASLGRIIGPATSGLVYKEFTVESPFYLACLLALIALGLVGISYKELPKGAKT